VNKFIVKKHDAVRAFQVSFPSYSPSTSDDTKKPYETPHNRYVKRTMAPSSTTTTSGGAPSSLALHHGVETNDDEMRWRHMAYDAINYLSAHIDPLILDGHISIDLQNTSIRSLDNSTYVHIMDLEHDASVSSVINVISDLGLTGIPRHWRQNDLLV
jgi:hypothetical protein